MNSVADIFFKKEIIEKIKNLLVHLYGLYK